jgi:hypothetical protein
MLNLWRSRVGGRMSKRLWGRGYNENREDRRLRLIKSPKMLNSLKVLDLYHRTHCKEISIYVFLEKDLRGLSPHCHIHVFVSDLYISTIGPTTYFPAIE